MSSGLIRIVCISTFALLSAFGAPLAQAQTCTVQATDLAFGTVDVLSNANSDTTGTISISCSGTAHEVVRVCLNIGHPNGSMPDGTSRIALGGTDQLQFQIYSDPGYRQPWGSWQQGSLGGIEVDIPLGADGTAPPVQRLMYGRVFGGQSRLLPTRYVASFSGSQTLFTAQYSRGIPCDALVSGSKRFPFTMSARVPARCSVSAAIMDFGTRGSLSSAIDASTCPTACRWMGGSPPSAIQPVGA
jgi:spore coat protein U-like protein